MMVRQLGVVPYGPTFDAMRAFTEARKDDSPDELWLCEHPPVFTLGLAGKVEHVLNPGDIPVVQSNRGGQVTYHGPGQLVAYPLIDLRRRGYFVKEYVFRLEAAILQTLDAFQVVGHRVAGAPGIYVNPDDPQGHAPRGGPQQDPFGGLAKVAALGIKVARHCTYHGLSINVAMDLEPFARINPCGYAGLRTVDLSTLGVSSHPFEVAPLLAERLQAQLQA